MEYAITVFEPVDLTRCPDQQRYVIGMAWVSEPARFDVALGPRPHLGCTEPSGFRIHQAQSVLPRFSIVERLGWALIGLTV